MSVDNKIHFRYLRDKISQQKIQISTITKGVPMTKIEVSLVFKASFSKSVSIISVSMPELQFDPA